KTEKLITLFPVWTGTTLVSKCARKRDVLNRWWLVGLCRKIVQADAPKVHQTALLRNAVINKIDINSPLKRI
ncbi:hypothetical protein TNCV_3060831, partial [Trichonephila clavipes]